jgi:hypothetical protein
VPTSERVGASIRSSPHPRVVCGDSYQWDSGRARIGAWPTRAPDRAVLSEPYLRIGPHLPWGYLSQYAGTVGKFGTSRQSNRPLRT